MNNNQNEHPEYVKEEYNNSNITITEQQNAYQQAVTDYTFEDKKTNRKKFIKHLIFVIIALVHHFLLHNYINDFLEKTLTDINLETKTINIITTIYLVISILFVVITVWNLIKKSKFLRIIFAVVLAAFVFVYGRKFYNNYKLVNDYKNTVSSSLVIRSKELCKTAHELWKTDAITKGARRVVFTGVDGKHCNNDIYIYMDKSVSYTITVSENGDVIVFKITDGKFQLNYSGSGLLYGNIKSDMFEKVTENNKIVIPPCTN